MKRFSLLAAAFVFFTATSAMAVNYAGRFGAGAGLGATLPIGGDLLSNRFTASWNGTVYGRYHAASTWGVEFGYSHADFKGVDTTLNTLSALYFYRPMPESTLTPVWGVGLGVSKFTNNPTGGTQMDILGRLGAEYAFKEDWSAAFHWDYEIVRRYFHDTAHIFLPKLTLTHYFDKK